MSEPKDDPKERDAATIDLDRKTEGELDEIAQIMERLQAENKNLKKDLQKISDALVASGSELKTATEERRAEVEKMKLQHAKEVSGYQSQITDLQAQLEKARKKEEELETEKQKSQKLVTDLQTKNAEATVLSREIDSLKSQIVELQGRLKEREDQAESIKSLEAEIKRRDEAEKKREKAEAEMRRQEEDRRRQKEEEDARRKAAEVEAQRRSAEAERQKNEDLKRREAEARTADKDLKREAPKSSTPAMGPTAYVDMGPKQELNPKSTKNTLTLKVKAPVKKPKVQQEVVAEPAPQTPVGVIKTAPEPEYQQATRIPAKAKAASSVAKISGPKAAGIAESVKPQDVYIQRDASQPAPTIIKKPTQKPFSAKKSAPSIPIPLPEQTATFHSPKTEMPPAGERKLSSEPKASEPIVSAPAASADKGRTVSPLYNAVLKRAEKLSRKDKDYSELPSPAANEGWVQLVKKAHKVIDEHSVMKIPSVGLTTKMHDKQAKKQAKGESLPHDADQTWMEHQKDKIEIYKNWKVKGEGASNEASYQLVHQEAGSEKPDRVATVTRIVPEKPEEAVIQIKSTEGELTDDMIFLMVEQAYQVSRMTGDKEMEISDCSAEIAIRVSEIARKTGMMPIINDPELNKQVEELQKQRPKP